MKNVLLLSMTVLLIAGSACAQDEPREVNITWYGHASFVITTPGLVSVLTDPINMEDYRIPEDVTPDIVTVSHNHRDHNAVEVISGDPLLIYGKERTGIDPNQKVLPIDTTVSGIRIYTVESNHFPLQESPCLNAIFVFEFDGIRLAHLGDLGQTLTDEQIEKIGPVDIVMIPVGGKYTVSGARADKVIEQLNPSRLVIPMHFRTYVADFLPYTADDFVKGKTNIERVAGSEYVLDVGTKPDAVTYIVFDTFADEK